MRSGAAPAPTSTSPSPVARPASTPASTSTARRRSPPRTSQQVHGIPCTTVARTILDLAQVIKGRPLERALDQAEILDLLDLAALDDQIERNKARPAAKRLQAVLDQHYVGSTPTWSELEEAFLAACRRAKLPMPEVNAWIDPRRRRSHRDPRGLRLARATGDRRDRRPRDPPHPTGLRGGPPTRSAADRRRLDRDPHHLAPADPAPERNHRPYSPATESRARRRRPRAARGSPAAAAARAPVRPGRRRACGSTASGPRAAWSP